MPDLRILPPYSTAACLLAIPADAFFPSSSTCLTLPAVSYLEMARAAVENATRTAVAELRNVVWAPPIVIAQPTDVVTVSARIVDEHTNGLAVTLNYRVDGAAGFTATPMFDDGTHGDGLAGDGIYGAILPAQPASTVVEFYLQARDENFLQAG